MPKFFLVPFADKDKAKSLGAWWDPGQSSWYAPNEPAAIALAGAGFKAVADPSPIVALPGEDRAFGGSALFVDLVPRSCWFTNVRYCVDPADWIRLSKGIRQRASHACEVCSSNENLEAHERWSFDEEQRIQTLKRIICLCKLCHQTTHYGLAQLRGLEDEVFAHLKAVNEWEDHEASAHVSNAFELWLERSQRTWELDLSIIEGAGIGILRPVKRDDRAGLADEFPA